MGKPLEVFPIDYGRSFLANPSPANSVRFWIESRTILFDDAGGEPVHFYQCASCKSENTFGEKDLLYADNYDFMPIFGGEDLLIFRRYVRIMPGRYRQLQKAEDVWGTPIFKLVPAKPFIVLDGWNQIRDATAEGLPLITQTEIRNEETGLRAIVECPTKTMNISIDKKMYQVDTGPIAFPDLSKRFDPPIDCLRLAFVVFNSPHFADFVIEQPTPVDQEGTGETKVYHYSNPFSISVKNTVMAQGS